MYVFGFVSAVYCTHVTQHTDNAQHAFSPDHGTALHLALPALEGLHKAWSRRLMRAKYRHFVPALKAGLGKIEEYYERNPDSDASIFPMC